MTWWYFRRMLLLLGLVGSHDDVIKWRHFPRNWPFVRGIHRSPVNSLHKAQWRGALMLSLICARINGRVNNGEAGDLRRYRAHCDVIVMHNRIQWHCNMYYGPHSSRRNFLSSLLCLWPPFSQPRVFIWLSWLYLSLSSMSSRWAHSASRNHLKLWPYTPLITQRRGAAGPIGTCITLMREKGYGWLNGHHTHYRWRRQGMWLVKWGHTWMERGMYPSLCHTRVTPIQPVALFYL